VRCSGAGVVAPCLMTAPPGARLPRSTAMPPIGKIGAFLDRIEVGRGRSRREHHAPSAERLTATARVRMVKRGKRKSP
jgi:hypothetical protein